MGDHYNYRKQKGAQRRNNKLNKDKLCRVGASTSQSDTFDPFEPVIGLYWDNVLQNDDNQVVINRWDGRTTNYLNCYSDVDILKAISHSFNFRKLKDIRTYLQNIGCFTHANFQELRSICYKMKSNPHRKEFCYECGSHRCIRIDRNAKKKKKTNRKMIKQFSEKKIGNTFHSTTWKIESTKKTKKPKQECEICRKLKPDCINLHCGKKICKKCEDKMSFSKNGCWFCRTQTCIRKKFTITLMNGAPIESVMGVGFANSLTSSLSTWFSQNS